MKVQEILDHINTLKPRSAWDKGVVEYMKELLENIEDEEEIVNPRLLRKALLYGAEDWNQYSWGGCSFAHDQDIAERLCNRTELKRTHNGNLNPNKQESWLDVQARALYQAAEKIVGICYPEE